MFKFSKDSVISSIDENIRQMLLQLQANISNAEFDCEQMIENIEKAIDTRNIML